LRLWWGPVRQAKRRHGREKSLYSTVHLRQNNFL
jgi:hypothetical protein